MSGTKRKRSQFETGLVVALKQAGHEMGGGVVVEIRRKIANPNTVMFAPAI